MHSYTDFWGLVVFDEFCFILTHVVADCTFDTIFLSLAT